MQRNTAMLEYGPNLHRELFTAFLFIAFPEANAGRTLAVLGFGSPQFRGSADRAAMRANRAIRP
jgi:hypothetical protein